MEYQHFTHRIMANEGLGTSGLHKQECAKWGLGDLPEGTNKNVANGPCDRWPPDCPDYLMAYHASGYLVCGLRDGRQFARSRLEKLQWATLDAPGGRIELT